MAHLLADLGWVDLDLGSSTGRWAVSATTSCPTRGWNIPHLINPTKVRNHYGHPVLNGNYNQPFLAPSWPLRPARSPSGQTSAECTPARPASLTFEIPAIFKIPISQADLSHHHDGQHQGDRERGPGDPRLSPGWEFNRKHLGIAHC